MIVLAFVGLASSCHSPKADTDAQADQEVGKQIHYLEIITPDVDGVCAAYAAALGVEFGEPVPHLGSARTAPKPGGGLIGVRAPMHGGEEPVVRPYWLVDDLASSVAAFTAAGAKIAVPPMQVPGHGMFALYFLGDTQHGLWQLK